MTPVPIEGLAGGYLLVELTKFLVTSLRKNTFGEEQRLQLSELYHRERANQEKTLEILRDIASNQKEHARIMQIILERVDR